MQIFEGFNYHIYNQANNREYIFRDDEDYTYFLKRTKIWVAEKSDILAYCIMPNHFHFLIHANSSSIERVKVGSLWLSQISNGFRLLQSQYAQYFNRKYGSSGSIFRPKIKWKLLNDSNTDYTTNCFNYIHDNPNKGGLELIDKVWKYSSQAEYRGKSKNDLINIEIAKCFVKADWERFK